MEMPRTILTWDMTKNKNKGMKKVVTFGEIMLRLAPPGFLRFSQANSFDVVYGGGESNVAVSLANYGVPVDFVTRLPKNDIGEHCAWPSRKSLSCASPSALIGKNAVNEVLTFFPSFSLPSSSVTSTIRRCPCDVVPVLSFSIERTTHMTSTL